MISKIPLDFVANNVSADMDYSFLHRHYDGNLLLGKIDSKWKTTVRWCGQRRLISPGRDSLDVKSLKATSGRSRVQASGRLVNFRQPNVVAKYDLTLDLAEASAVARRPEIRQGVLQATGKVRGQPRVFPLPASSR